MKRLTHSRWLTSFAIALLLVLAAPAAMATHTFKIDPTHTFIQFRISHLGFSILNGRFNTIEGHFGYDEVQPENSYILMKVDTASIDTNHAERDKHLRGEDFLNVEKFPTATFTSISFEEEGKTGTLHGDLELHGITKRIEVYVQRLGGGEDPWGGVRQGFKGQTTIKLKDFGIERDLGPASETLHLDIYIEGKRTY
jgi:polyisoprenoid-binding protein YceI